jgi:hypothetical protein
MEMKRILRDDLFGIFFVKKPDGTKWQSYYNTIDSLRTLFQDEKFRKVVDGFYLNICGNFDSVRISYFISRSNSQKALSVFQHFFRNNKIVEIKPFEKPKRIVLAQFYGGGKFEEQFRNFLVLETKIGLDLIKTDLLQARILFATYRWQVRKASLSFRDHFELVFKKYSKTYNSLSEDEKDQFFTDLEEWPNPPQVDWAHMMVNFVLGCDWNSIFGDPNYLTPSRPLSIPEINKILSNSNLGFQIPLDWKPSQ